MQSLFRAKIAPQNGWNVAIDGIEWIDPDGSVMGPDGSQVSARRLQLHLGDLFDFPLRAGSPGSPVCPPLVGRVLVTGNSWLGFMSVPWDNNMIWLVVSNIFLFAILYGIIIPTDSLSYFSEGLKPPTRWCKQFYWFVNRIRTTTLFHLHGHLYGPCRVLTPHPSLP